MSMLSIYGEDSLSELSNVLRDAGLCTEPKRYQLRGIKFLWDHFKRRANTLAMHPYDWFPLTKSVSSSNTIWFNVVTHQVVHSIEAPVTAQVYSCGSCILSDEPGLGKTLTCLSLALLVKIQEPSSPIFLLMCLVLKESL